MANIVADSEFMAMALDEARDALGWSSPNPAVGCIVVKDGSVVGRGHTAPCGGPHAEPNALADAGENARGATAYVTLEPCAHHGRTPPCTDALIDAGVRKVVIAATDPDPVSLNGIDVLRSAGIEVESGLMQREALEIIAGFVKYTKKGLPLVRYKYAMTADGHLATRSGSSSWISCEAARDEVQIMRKQSDAVLVGSGTALADDPRLNVRLGADSFQPRRVVVDSEGKLLPDCSLFRENGGEIIVLVNDRASSGTRKKLSDAGARIIDVDSTPDGKVNLCSGLKELGKLGVRTVLCEGGSALAGGFFDAGLIDEVICYIAPKICGGSTAPGPVGGKGVEWMESATLLEDVTFRQVGTDICLRGKVGPWDWLESDE